MRPVLKEFERLDLKSLGDLLDRLDGQIGRIPSLYSLQIFIIDPNNSRQFFLSKPLFLPKYPDV